MPGRSNLPRILLAVGLPLIGGCGEELNPERFTTSRVAGIVRLGDQPVGGGFVEVVPAEGTRGNSRVAPIGPDGRFAIDRAPVGKVVIGLDQLPIRSIATPLGPVEAGRFRSIWGTIRGTIPEGPGSDLPIDLIDEAIRSKAHPRGSPRRRKRSGSRPGRMPVEAGPDVIPPERPDRRAEPTIRVIYRDSSGIVHRDWPSDRLAEAIADAEGTLWVDVEDLESANNDQVEAMLLGLFGFHPLSVKDALQDTHVPRIDDWGRYLYLVVNAIDFDPESDEVRTHELDFFLGPNYLVSYHNEAIGVLDRHRRSLEREPEGRPKLGSDHLLYRLLDELVADYLPAIEHLDGEIDDAQDEVFREPTSRTLRTIFHVKRRANQLHRLVIPIREVVNRLARDDYATVDRDCRVYFRDVYDHLVRIHDILESLRDLIAGALDTYLSVASNRTNEIMKALTVVNVMFLPLTFVVGFFGMNFFGPTLAFEWPILPKGTLFWITMAAMTGIPVLFWRLARRRGWLG